MKFPVSALVFLAISLSAVTTQSDEVKNDKEPKAEKWFDLNTGDSWSLSDSSGGIKIKVLEAEELNGEKAVKVGWYELGSETRYQTEFWRKRGDAYYVVGREISGRKFLFDEPYVFMKETAKPGDTWVSTIKVMGRKIELTFTVGKIETIKTKIGDFEAIKVSVNGPGQSIDRWYAPSVGMVKEIGRVSLGGRTSPGNEKTLFEYTEGAE